MGLLAAATAATHLSRSLFNGPLLLALPFVLALLDHVMRYASPHQARISKAVSPTCLLRRISGLNA